MFEFARRMIAALLNRLGPSRPPEDPYAAVREPRRRNPGGGRSAVALEEPEVPKAVRAVGTTGPRWNQEDSSED
jgi:hypothetical protein